MPPTLSLQPRNTERCPQCSYLLEGLPDSGQCPECGHSYEQTSITIDGWLAGGHFSGNIYFSRTLGALFASLTYCVWIVVVFAFDFRGLSNGLGLLPLLLPIGVYVLCRFAQRDCPPMQLILWPSGYVQRLHPGNASTALRYLANAVVIAPVPLLLGLRSPGIMLSIAVLYVGGFLLVSGMTILWKYLRQGRRPANPFRTAPQNPPLAPWRVLDEVIVQRTGPGTWQITVANAYVKRSAASRALTQGGVYFDADLTEERLEHLLAEIASWPAKITVRRDPPRPTWFQRLTGRVPVTQSGEAEQPPG